MTINEALKNRRVTYKGKPGTITAFPSGGSLVQITMDSGAKFIVDISSIADSLPGKLREAVKRMRPVVSAVTKPVTRVVTSVGDKTVVEALFDDDSPAAAPVTIDKTTAIDVATKPVAVGKVVEPEDTAKYEIPDPELTLSPYAWAKLIFLRDHTDNEVGAFGIAETDNPLLITDVYLPKQKVTSVSVEFDDDSIADYFDEMVDRGLKPENFARVWIHTHPGMAPNPSTVDETTFFKAFGRCDWAVMMIIGESSRYARLQFNTGPKGSQKLTTYVSYKCDFKASDKAAWKAEYDNRVTEDKLHVSPELAYFFKTRKWSAGDEHEAIAGYAGYESYRGYDVRASCGNNFLGETGGFTDSVTNASEIFLPIETEDEPDRSNIDWQAVYRLSGLAAWNVQELEALDEDERADHLLEHYNIDVDELVELNLIHDIPEEDIAVVDTIADEIAADNAAIRHAYKQQRRRDKKLKKKQRREAIEV